MELLLRIVIIAVVKLYNIIITIQIGTLY